MAILRVTFAGILFIAVSPGFAFAQTGSVRLTSTMQLQLNCERPLKVTNYNMRATLRAVLNPDRSATADLAFVGFFMNANARFDTRLGREWIAAPGGTSQLRVVANNRLRGIWRLPNNDLILDMAFNGPSCAASLAVKLKPGKSEYTLYGTKFHYCSTVRVIGASCAAN